LIPA